MSANIRMRMFKAAVLPVVVLFCAVAAARAAEPTPWVVDETGDWKEAAAEAQNLSLSDGLARPTAGDAEFRSVVKTCAEKRHADRLVFEQPPSWDNWRPVSGVEPEGGGDAPVFVVAGEDDYWYLNAQKGGGRYSAWHSTDMENWTLHENAVGRDWVTTAEYADGTFYIYYDEPNDEDPHLLMDDDLTDTSRRDVGEVFADPSHGSDAGVFRAADGSFHLIYEDWNPIDASAHSWDSPLAGHAESPDGVEGFEPHEHPAPIDERTVPIPEFGTFTHPDGTYRYHRHRRPQDAYGDFTVIRVGGQYYIFCDYHPHDAPMRMACWTSDSLRGEFRRAGEIGEDFHPDPTIGFAEGRFYLFAQGQDFVSPGPWVPRVRARAGVDSDGDGAVDRWTDWQEVEEQYARREGDSRIVDSAAASLDLSGLPAGRGFAFQFRLSDATEPPSEPRISRVGLTFE